MRNNQRKYKVETDHIKEKVIRKKDLDERQV